MVQKERTPKGQIVASNRQQSIRSKHLLWLTLLVLLAAAPWCAVVIMLIPHSDPPIPTLIVLQNVSTSVPDSTSLTTPTPPDALISQKIVFAPLVIVPTSDSILPPPAVPTAESTESNPVEATVSAAQTSTVTAVSSTVIPSATLLVPVVTPTQSVGHGDNPLPPRLFMYPFKDDMETGSHKWLSEAWELSANSYQSPQNAWETLSDGNQKNLTLNGSVDLSSKNVIAPKLVFWSYGTSSGMLNIEISNDLGHTWTEMMEVSQSTWSSHVISLSNYIGQRVTVRFSKTDIGGQDWWIDDVLIGEADLPSPTPTPTLLPSETPTPTPTGTPFIISSVVPIPTAVPSSTPTVTEVPTHIPTRTPTNTPTTTLTFTLTPSLTATPTNTPTSTLTFTFTPSPTATLTNTPPPPPTFTLIPTLIPSATPVMTATPVYTVDFLVNLIETCVISPSGLPTELINHIQNGQWDLLIQKFNNLTADSINPACLNGTTLDEFKAYLISIAIYLSTH